MNIFRKLLNGMTAATVAVVILVTGAAALAVSATNGSPQAATTPTIVEATNTLSLEVGGRVAIPVAEIGMATVARTATGLHLASATAEPGWQVLVDVADGRELEVSFRSEGLRHKLNVEIEDGEIRIRILSTTGQLENSSTSSTSTTTPGADSSTSTSTTTPGANSSTSTSTTTPGANSSTSTSTTTPSSSTTLPSAPAEVTLRDVVVLDAGSVTYAVDGAQLLIVGVFPNDGWSPTVELSIGREVEVSFRNSGARVDLNLQLEGNQVRVRIRDRRTDTRTEVMVPASDSPSGSTSSSTSTTVPTSSTTVPTSSTTVPTSSTTVPPVEAETITFTLTGGTTAISFSASGVTVLWATPNPGFDVKIEPESPGWKVEFRSDTHRSRIDAWWNGGPVFDIEERDN